MGILLAFLPFIVFAVVDRIVSPTAGLVAGALVSAGLVLWQWLVRRQSPKILEAGSLLLFGALAVYAVVEGTSWSVIGTRLCVDAGLLLIVLVSVAVGRPFTLQYAREQVDPAFWGDPQFLRTNYVITGVWALAFAVMVLAELALLYVPGVPRQAGVLVIIAALVGAVKFTGWYPERVS